MSDNAKNAMDGGFAKYVPGFEFLQSLTGQGEGGSPSLSSLGSWVAPTFNVEDLEKRIEELKAVQFWLDQNAKALAATIQALEVQKMTLTTLKTMNLSMGDVAQSLGAMVGLGGGAAPAEAPAPSNFPGLEIPARTYGNPSAAPETDASSSQDSQTHQEPSDEQATPAGSSASGTVDPMQWWGALTQQFQQIASTALQDASRQMGQGVADAAASSPAAAKPARQNAARKAPAKKAVARKAAVKKTAASKSTRPTKAAAPQALPAGEWPIPTGFFQLPGFPGMGEPASKKTAARKTAGAAAPTRSAQKPAARQKAAKKTPARKAAPAKRPR